MEIPRHCTLCPRACGADRRHARGFCGGGAQVRLARAALHFGEEPCISGTHGSGTVFFSGCSLRCCFCQNFPISAQNQGTDISIERLGDIFLELQAQGAHNINLVNPTHYVPWIVHALQRVRPQLRIPVIYNTGGYDRPDTLASLAGLVDVYLPDLKYIDATRAARYSRAADYPAVAKRAIAAMVAQAGPFTLDEQGMLVQGVLIRHLILPGGRRDAMDAVRWVSDTFAPGTVRMSLMRQYTPMYKSADYPEIDRTLTSFEYESVLHMAAQAGMSGYRQGRSSATSEQTPAFDGTGVLHAD